MYLDRVVMKPIHLQSNNLQKRKESLQYFDKSYFIERRNYLEEMSI